MEFSKHLDLGSPSVQLHLDRALIQLKLDSYLRLGVYRSVYSVRFEIWEKVVWCWVPGRRPRFISRAVLGV